MNVNGLILGTIMLLFSGAVSAENQQVKVVGACHIANVVTEAVPAEFNAEIAQALKDNPNIGGTVYIYIKNGSNQPASIKSVYLNGVNLNDRLKAPDYDVIWWRNSPKIIAPGAESEITICLRKSLQNDTKVAVDFEGGGRVEQIVSARYSGPRLSTLAFTPDLATAYLYIDSNIGEKPSAVYVDGQKVRFSSKILGAKNSPGLVIVNVSPVSGFRQGSRHLFRVVFGKQSCAASVRALGDVSRFGTYGIPDWQTYASAGFDSNISFFTLDEKALNDFSSVGMKVAMTIGLNKPSPYMIGNPGVYGYLAMDEPDCGDFSKDTTRPMAKRLGTQAQSLTDWGSECEQADPSIPTMTTIDLTFAPQNYFTYAKVADIANPDCYTVVIGWPLTTFRDKMAIMKRASAPQPFFATYQGHWEEWVKDLGSRYVGGAEIAANGSDAMVDTTKLRGYGRAPSPEESRIPMLYAIGSGAHGLFNYICSTEAFSTMLFHSTRVIPEVWQMVTRTSRELRTVAPLIQISHPMNWCKSDRSDLWVKTLVCGENAAMVVAVNEACKSETAGFISSPINNSTFSFNDMPWMKGLRVYKLGDGKLELLKSCRMENTLKWKENAIVDGEVYLICSSKTLAGDLVKNYLSKARYITADGKKAPQEGYLNGRRKTPKS